jgi:hypothetical protein
MKTKSDLLKQLKETRALKPKGTAGIVTKHALIRALERSLKALG